MRAGDGLSSVLGEISIHLGSQRGLSQFKSSNCLLIWPNIRRRFGPSVSIRMAEPGCYGGNSWSHFSFYFNLTFYFYPLLLPGTLRMIDFSAKWKCLELLSEHM